MPVTLTCSGCKSTLKVRDDLAGKKVKCPKCATLLTVPAAEEEFAPVEVASPEDSVVDAPPPDKKPRPARDEDEDDRPRGKSRRRDEDDEDEDARDRKRDPDRGGKRETGIRTSRDRGRDDEDDEDEDDRDRKRRRGRDRDIDKRRGKQPVYEPCPKCQATGAKRVKWTPWGSFYGPAMFTHVRCPECGYAYNGKTGGSNLIPAILLVSVPLLGILGIVGGLAIYLMQYYKATQLH